MSALDIDSLPGSTLIKIPELAEILGTSPGRVRNLMWQGRGPRRIKIGKSVRIKIADVRAWLDAQADPSPTTPTTPKTPKA